MIALLFKPTYTKPSNDFEARLLGVLAVEKFLKDNGPGKEGEGLERLRTFFRDNPGLIITSKHLHQIGIGSQSDRRRRGLIRQGYMTKSFKHDKNLSHKEYRIIGYDPKAVNTLYTCPQDVRAKIIERDNGMCRSCAYEFGTIHPDTGQKEPPHIHRTIPGSLYEFNETCLTYCSPCNQGLGDKIVAKKSRCEIIAEVALKYGCTI